MKDTIPVLCPVYNVNKRTSKAKARQSKDSKCEEPTQQEVNESLLNSIRRELTDLSSCYEPFIHNQVQQHLTAPTKDNEYMLDAWERCGRQDFKRSLPVKFRRVLKETFSPLGIACLIKYARGYLDEAEAATAATHRRD